MEVSEIKFLKLPPEMGLLADEVRGGNQRGFDLPRFSEADCWRA
jgi:hypothetical protein